MHLEVKVAINFIVSYLYNKLPRRRADLFGEELEQILLTRYEGHWYCEDPLRGSAYRCLHLGFIKDPTVELAAKRSGLDTEEVRANVPEELAVWIDPHEVSYRIGEGGALKVLYFDNPLGLGSESGGEVVSAAEGDLVTMVEDMKNMAFNPEAQVFVPISDQMSPVLLPSLSNSPTPLSTSSCQAMYGYSASSTPTNQATTHSSNTSTPSPPSATLPYLQAQQHQHQHQQQHASLPPPNARPPPQPITFTTASFAATKFGSTKMKKSSAGAGNTVMPSMGMPPVPPPPPPPLPLPQHQQVQQQQQQQMLSRTPTTSISPPGLLKHKALSLSLHSLGGGQVSSQLSPNAKEFVFPSAQGHLFFDVDATTAATSTLQPHSCPFQSAPPALTAHPHAHPPFDPFSSPPPGQAVGIINANTGLSFVEKPAFVEGLSGYNLQYPNQAFQPVVLAN